VNIREINTAPQFAWFSVGLVQERLIRLTLNYWTVFIILR